MKLSDQIRRAVDDSGMVRNEICRRAGIHKSALSRIMSGERGISSEAMDRLGEVLKLRIVSGMKAGKGKG